MIQRVQSIWMILAAIAIFLTLKLPFYSGTLLTDNSFDSLIATDNFILMVLTCALGSALVINIFLFKHRTLQFRICIIAILTELLLLFLYYRQTKLYSNQMRVRSFRRPMPLIMKTRRHTRWRPNTLWRSTQLRDVWTQPFTLPPQSNWRGYLIYAPE